MKNALFFIPNNFTAEFYIILRNVTERIACFLGKFVDAGVFFRSGAGGFFKCFAKVSRIVKIQFFGYLQNGVVSPGQVLFRLFDSERGPKVRKTLLIPF